MQSSIIIFILKEPYAVFAYGSLIALFSEQKKNIKRSMNYFHRKRVDLDLEDYEDDNCLIFKRHIIRSKHKLIK